jgi:hypothetical protein
VTHTTWFTCGILRRSVSTLRTLDGMEEQCSFLMHDGAPACAKGMVDVFSRIGDQARTQKWDLIRQSAGHPASEPEIARCLRKRT